VDGILQAAPEWIHIPFKASSNGRQVKST